MYRNKLKTIFLLEKSVLLTRGVVKVMYCTYNWCLIPCTRGRVGLIDMQVTWSYFISQISVTKIVTFTREFFLSLPPFLSLSLSPSLLWRPGPIPGHGLPLRSFATTLTGHITLVRTPLDEWSAQRTDLYLTTHNTYRSQDRYPFFRGYSDLQSQSASGRWPRP
jgi:hypothetical protein